MDGYFSTDRHDRIRSEVRSFAEAEVRPRIAAMEEDRGVAYELSRLIARQGWIGATIGAGYGGMDAGHVAKTIIIEELSRVSGAMGAMVQASQLGTAKIQHFGSDAQKQQWLPAVARGDCLPTIAVTELTSGSHVLGMATTARREGSSYVLNGRKAYVGNSHVGDLHGVVARTGGTGSRALSAFLVEADRPGFSTAPHRPAVGLPGFSFGELIFDECRIPAANLLGSEGDGLDVAYSSSILVGRPNLTAVSLGIHEAVVAETVRFAGRQRRYGKPLAELPTIRDQLGRMQSQLMTARLAAYHAAHLLDRGIACDAELQNAKLVNAEYALDSARLAVEIHGAYVLFPDDSPIARYQRDAFHILPPAGTSAVQRLRLAEFALGQVKGAPWSTRFAPEEPDDVVTLIPAPREALVEAEAV
ncbi:acyl-CoA dehydrogenase family protein [Cryptosporangium phraense]|uniref:Acyl-CoA dehydrogenase n=1 Tax=Cryptosporangium phraense TaxID=2593070 RepID=A0A545AKZ2_9ACTN|nr:acyl-CoA dehydrogenase family protein [Cryptosporangium phraense]TQS41996.1 acyl-CoA dehydrogenase [Cryptosporangium phraense]